MSKPPLWVRIVVGILGAMLVGYAGYQLALLAAVSVEGATVVGLILAAWLGIYLIWGRKLAARFRK